VLLPLGILASSGGAAAADYELISTTVLSSTASSVNFTSLGTAAAAYKHLQVRATVRSARNLVGDELLFGFNSDTAWGTTYKGHRLYGNGSSVSSGNTGTIYMADTPGATATSGAYAAVIIDILDFASTTKNKTIRALFGNASNNNVIMLTSGLWISTSAVTSVNLIDGNDNFAIGSRFSLYGLKG